VGFPDSLLFFFNALREFDRFLPAGLSGTKKVLEHFAG
jgi:hypothetical protein